MKFAKRNNHQKLDKVFKYKTLTKMPHSPSNFICLRIECNLQLWEFIFVIKLINSITISTILSLKDMENRLMERPFADWLAEK